MQVSGLVIHFSGAVHAPEVRAALRGRPGLELGAGPDPHRVPAVLEAESAGESEEIVRRLEALDGVSRVEVVFVADERGRAGAPEETSDAVGSA